MYWNEKPYHSLDYEMKRIYGHKIYKLALDGGMTCPNRDGTLGSNGCIFCSGGRFRRICRVHGRSPICHRADRSGKGSGGEENVKGS